MRALEKNYDPSQVEAQWYDFWESQGCFDAKDVSAPGQESFSIVIPPPNVTGVLHMGHALTNTIQDILARWQRMKGKNTLWLPGTDHAGIATQAQVEKALAKEGKTRQAIGREKFLERTWQWKEEHGREITKQMRKMGWSLDWKRERFTLDAGLSNAVREVFVRLYEEGLIYRGSRIINWCVRCQTALSDLEVIPTERRGKLFHIRYEVPAAKGSVTVATTRPETLLGDTAVALHPKDERYKKFHGKEAKLPLVGRMLPILLDEYVDLEFGTGALKVTPAHDFNDFELGQKYKLPSISVMGKDGKITSEGGEYAGLKFTEAREKVLADLEDAGLLEKTEDHVHKVGLCQRCDQVVEPLISPQWFVKIAPLAKPAIEAVETGAIEFRPKSWEKTYFEWMRNIRDWCISRQLWWGHQIPAWHCGDCEEITVSRTTPSKCKACGKGSLKQDEDVLDTWFSSGLWPFGTLGWPEKTQALKTFYPTSILETGFDIIFFWVARMIMMGIHFMGDVPFKRVYLSAMVRDEKGEKMSKSKGNVIDPLEVTKVHGADALRFTLAVMAGQGRDIKLSVDRVAGYRTFANKLWNAVRFFHLHSAEVQGWDPSKKWTVEGLRSQIESERKNLRTFEKWILSRVEKLAEDVEKGLEGFELNLASQGLYDFIWGEYCDWFIEFSKSTKDPKNLAVSLYVLDRILRLLHPIMPFVTEELWQSLPLESVKGKPNTIMLQEFPKSHSVFNDEEAESSIAYLKRHTEAVRNFRGENQISPKVAFPVHFIAADVKAEDKFKQNQSAIESLIKIAGFHKGAFTGKGATSVISIPEDGIQYQIPLAGLVNQDAEIERLTKEIVKTEADLAHFRSKLTKESFLEKAPKELIEKERKSEEEAIQKLAKLQETLKRLRESA